ncbi:hypothetical protein Tco_0241910 [Tanacetum coccineum]
MRLRPALDPSHSSNKPVIVEVPKRTSTVSMEYTSLEELKRFLTGFDQVVKERTTAKLSLEGTWSQAKDTVIVKLKEQIKSLTGNVEDSLVKMDMDEIETLNIELEHRVTKLSMTFFSARGSQLQDYQGMRICQTPSSNSKNKVEAHPRNVKSSLNKRNGTVKVTGSASVQKSKKQDDSDSVCVNSNDCMSSDNVCVSNDVNVVKSRAKPKKNKPKKDIWIHGKGVHSDRIYLETYRLSTNRPLEFRYGARAL